MIETEKIAQNIHIPLGDIGAGFLNTILGIIGGIFGLIPAWVYFIGISGIIAWTIYFYWWNFFR